MFWMVHHVYNLFILLIVMTVNCKLPFPNIQHVQHVQELSLQQLTHIAINSTVIIGCTGGKSNESWYLWKGDKLLIDDGSVNSDYSLDDIHATHTMHDMYIEFKTFSRDYLDVYTCVCEKMTSSNSIDLNDIFENELFLDLKTQIAINSTVIIGCTGGKSNESWYLWKGDKLLIDDGSLNSDYSLDDIHTNHTMHDMYIEFKKFSRDYLDVYKCVRVKGASSNRLDLNHIFKNELYLDLKTHIAINSTVIIGCTGGKSNESWYLWKGNKLLIDDGSVNSDYSLDDIHANHTMHDMYIEFKTFSRDYLDVYKCVSVKRASSNRLDLKDIFKNELSRNSPVSESAFDCKILIIVVILVVGIVMPVIVMIVKLCFKKEVLSCGLSESQESSADHDNDNESSSESSTKEETKVLMTDEDGSTDIVKENKSQESSADHDNDNESSSESSTKEETKVLMTDEDGSTDIVKENS